jgi:hypothetical protein
MRSRTGSKTRLTKARGRASTVAQKSDDGGCGSKQGSELGGRSRMNFGIQLPETRLGF